MTAQKITKFILNMLLIIGAFLSVVTIDQGKWIPSYLSFLSSGDGWDTNNQIQNTHPDGRAGIGVKATPQAQGACLAPSQLSNPEWDDIYMLVNSYNTAVIERTHHEVVAKTQVVCEN